MWTDFVLFGSLVFFAAYFCWYVFVGKALQPVTTQEIDLMWRLHKTQTRCKGARIADLILYREKVVGFRCECGYEFKQRRLLVQNVQKVPNPVKSNNWEQEAHVKE